MSESQDKLATPLWNYALQVYAQTSARGWMQVLKQDYAIDGNLLIGAAYLALWQRRLEAADLAVLAESRVFFQAYHDKLQALHGRKALVSHPDWQSTWQDLLLKTELQAEQVQLAHLYELLRARPLRFMPWPEALEHNLILCVEVARLDTRADLHLQGLIAALKKLPPVRTGGLIQGCVRLNPCRLPPDYRF